MKNVQSFGFCDTTSAIWCQRKKLLEMIRVNRRRGCVSPEINVPFLKLASDLRDVSRKFDGNLISRFSHIFFKFSCKIKFPWNLRGILLRFFICIHITQIWWKFNFCKFIFRAKLNSRQICVKCDANFKNGTFISKLTQPCRWFALIHINFSSSTPDGAAAQRWSKKL